MNKYLKINIFTTSQKFLNSKIFYVFLKNSLLLTKPAFIWSKSEIFFTV